LKRRLGHDAAREIRAAVLDVGVEIVKSLEISITHWAEADQFTFKHTGFLSRYL
jgi:hypothetical protein